MPINLGSAPDSLRIDINAYYGSGNTLTMGKSGSKLWIDGLQLLSQPQGVSQIFMGEKYNLNVYPNPSTGLFSMKTDDVISKIEIVTVLGEKIYSLDNFNSANTNQKQEIDLSNQSKGIYFYKIVSGDNNSSTGKIIFDNLLAYYIC